MKSLWLLTKKNLQLLLRSKSSALIVIFAPLLIILIISLSYNTTGTYNINVGIHAPLSNEDITKSFVDLLEEKEFSIKIYKKHIDECINDIKKDFIHVCVSLPENLEVFENTAKEVTFHIDPSKINLVWMIQDTVKSKFNLKSQEISQNITRNILTRITSTKEEIDLQKVKLQQIRDKTSSVSSYSETVKSSLINIDFSSPVTGQNKGLILTLNDQVSKSKSKVTKALSDLEDINVSSSDKLDIKNSLEDAQKNLNSASLALNGTGSGTVEALISSLEADTNKVKEKLSNVQSNVIDGSSNLDNVNSAIKEAVNSIDQLQTSISEIRNKLGDLKINNATTISSPLITKIEKVKKESTYLNYLFPAILVLVVMFSSLLLGTSLVMMEKNSPAFLRNFFIPIRRITFITATYLTNLILILVEIAIILGISLFFLEGALNVLPEIALILFLTASVFTFLGMVLGYIFTSEETGTLASISLGSLFLFFSGVVLPLEGLSKAVREIALLNPFVIAEKLIREIFFFNSQLSQVWLDLLLLFTYAIVLFLIILAIELILHKHIVQRFMKNHRRSHRQKEIRKNKDV